MSQLFVIRTFILSLILLSPWALKGQDKEAAHAPAGWLIERDEDQVRVYDRWMNNGQGKTSRQLRVEMKVMASLASVVATLKDDRDATKWINRAMVCYNFSIRDEYNWCNYLELNIPWPLNDQDLVTRVHLTQDPVSGMVRLEIKNDNNLIPLKDGIDRMPFFEGSWEIRPMGNGTVLVSYYLYTGQKQWLPRWIIDPVINYGVWKTLIDMRNVIQEKNKTGVKLNYIKE